MLADEEQHPDQPVAGLEALASALRDDSWFYGMFHYAAKRKERAAAGIVFVQARRIKDDAEVGLFKSNAVICIRKSKMTHVRANRVAAC